MDELEKRSLLELKETNDKVKEKILQKLLQRSKQINLLLIKKRIADLVSEEEKDET